MAIAANVNGNGTVVLGTPNAKHLYDLGVQWEHPVAGTQQMRIEVHANTRSQAAGFAARSGYTVRYVNMVG